MKAAKLLYFTLLAILFAYCKPIAEHKETSNMEQDTFEYFTEQFADLRVLRYQAPGFDQLSVRQKKLLYYLQEAALSGREIYYDQNNKNNLMLKRTFEAIMGQYKGDREAQAFKNFEVYVKRFWFSNGFHHHYSKEKFEPEFNKEYLSELMNNSPGAKFPLSKGETVDYLFQKIALVLFDPDYDRKSVIKDTGVDVVAESANNLYGEGVTQADVDSFYASITVPNDPRPISYGLNSKLVKEDGQVKEKVYRIGGMYGPALERIVFWLEKAVTVAESPQQAEVINKLIAYYQTGDLKTFDQYSIAWVEDIASDIDFTNGFIEDYDDPIAMRGAWQSTVYFKDPETTAKFEVMAKNAAWFEKNSPIMEAHKKENPTGISYKVINVVSEAGDCSPTTPIGVNLPNADWIRKEHGSKSVSLANIQDAYEQAGKSSGFTDEFYLPQQAALQKEHGGLSGKLHTGLHEVIGHGSGKIEPGVGTPTETLKSYASELEEARADLVALYYVMDPYMVEIGLMPSLDVAKAEYDSYITNGLMTQLVRIKRGAKIEQAHMRNRQTISSWAYEKGLANKVIEKKTVDGKTYFVVNDYQKLRELFGQLLREVQRIKSQGDYQAGKALIEGYGIQIDTVVHEEALARFAKLNIAPYAGFINPLLVPITEGDDVVDVKITYPEDFTEQMMYYAKNYRILPTSN